MKRRPVTYKKVMVKTHQIDLEMVVAEGRLTTLCKNLRKTHLHAQANQWRARRNDAYLEIKIEPIN